MARGRSGTVFSVFSYPVAAWLAKRIGPITTRVFPVEAFLDCGRILAGLLSSTDLLARFTLSQIDAPTRTSYAIDVVASAERTAASILGYENDRSIFKRRKVRAQLVLERIGQVNCVANRNARIGDDGDFGVQPMPHPTCADPP